MGFLYIIVDGIDGVGKTTQIKRIATELESRGLRVVQVREPGGTDIGAKIRTILLDKSSTGIAPATELLLFFADRSQLHHEILHREKAEAERTGTPTVVISDRGIPSTYAYQYHYSRFDSKLMVALEELSAMMQPGLVLLLDLDEKTALNRALARLQQTPANNAGGASGSMMEKEGRFESRGLGYYKSIREGFHNYFQGNKGAVDIRMIDASGSSDDVFEKILAELSHIPNTNVNTNVNTTDAHGRDTHGRDAHGRDAHINDAHGRDAHIKDAHLKDAHPRGRGNPQNMDNTLYLLGLRLAKSSDAVDGGASGVTMGEYAKVVEPPLFRAVLDYTNGNKTKTASILGLSRTTLRKKLHEYDLMDDTNPRKT